MRIVSKYKDFYDYLQHVYGQDLNIHWKRDIIDPNEKGVIILKNIDFTEFGERTLNGRRVRKHERYFEPPFYMWNYRRDFVYYISHVSILGEVYLICHYKDTNRFIDEYYSYEVYKQLPKTLFSKYIRDQEKKPLLEEEFENTINEYRILHKDSLMNLHRRFKAPILVIGNGYGSHTGVNHDTNDFCIDDFHYAFIRNRVMIFNDYIPLSNIKGLVSQLGSPESLYQRIYNFFIEIKDNKDIEPPVEVSDRDKIVKNGFDTKVSFRHPYKI